MPARGWLRVLTQQSCDCLTPNRRVFVCNRQGFVEEAKKLFAHGYMEEYELMTSALSIVNAVYIGIK